MNNDVNFCGAFVINYKNAAPELRERFERTAFLYKNKKQIIPQYRGNKDKVLYVLKNSRDYDVATFINHNKIRFEYLPEISTKLGIDPQFIEEAYATIDSIKTILIRKRKELMHFVNANRKSYRSVWSPNESRVCRVLKALKLKPEVEPLVELNGVVKYIDKAKNGEIIISPKGDHCKTFVYYKPSNKYDLPSFYIVDKHCENVRKLKTPDEILEFKKGFTSSLKIYANEQKQKLAAD